MSRKGIKCIETESRLMVARSYGKNRCVKIGMGKIGGRGTGGSGRVAVDRYSIYFAGDENSKIDYGDDHTTL